MIDKSQNKSLEASPEVEKKEILQDFFFPDYGLTIKAKNLEEAEKKLLEIINKK